MTKRKFEVKIYYSTFCTHIIEAKNNDDAISIVRNQMINENEALSNLESWEDADTSEEMKFYDF